MWAALSEPSTNWIDPAAFDSFLQEQLMYKENNCECVVCKVEQELLKTLNTQTSRNHFKALASDHPVSKDLSSPLEVVAQLHRQSEAVNHGRGNQILHSLIRAISEKAFEDLGQQLLLVAFTPAIHRTYRDVCGQFPALPREDVAQQASMLFLETARSSAMLHQNSHLAIALVREFRKSMFRWATKETRRCLVLQHNSAEDLASDTNFEAAILLREVLQQSRRIGILSQIEQQLLLKLKCEGFEAKELADVNCGITANAVCLRVSRTMTRLRRSATKLQKFLPSVTGFSGELPISKGEKEFSPERSQQVTHYQTDVACVGA
jgi:DNA-directed RNA polymerase specialized sigma24 family protein